MGWEKIGVTQIVKPAGHSGGLYLRILKETVDAYDLWTAEAVEYTIDRVKRPAVEDATKHPKRCVSKREGGEGG